MSSTARITIVVTVVVCLLVGLAAGLLIGQRLGVAPGQATPTSPTGTTLISPTSSPTTLTTIPSTPTTPTPTEAQPSYVLLVDAMGRLVNVSKPVTRIAVLAPSITEEVFALGAQDLIVAVDNCSDYPPAIVEWKRSGKVVDVGGYWWSVLSVEKVAMARPDLVLAEKGAHEPLLAKFEELGLKVVFLHGGAAESIDDVFWDIMTIGRALGVEERGAELVKELKERVDYVERKLIEANVTPVTVFIEVGEWGGIWTCGSGTFLNHLVSIAGGANVFSKYYGWVTVSPEDVVATNVSVIICVREELAGPEAYAELIASRPGWDAIPAVVEGRVWFAVGEGVDVLSRPGPRLGDALILLAKILHPEVFGEPPSDLVVKVSIGG